MEDQDLITCELSPLSNKDELHYREDVQQTEAIYDNFDKWKKKIGDGRLDYVHEIMKMVKFEGKILELGAGSSWFSCELSKLDRVKELYCLDFSEKILKEITPKVMDFLNADKGKMKRVVGDFYSLKFPDRMFDMVVVDAALHHIGSMDIVMKEIKRVMKDDGKVVAIREPIIPKMRPGSKETFGAHERSLGLIENIYTKEEWKGFFERNGLKLSFMPVIPEYSFAHKAIKYTPLRLLNGYLFAHYVLIATKTKDE